MLTISITFFCQDMSESTCRATPTGRSKTLWLRFSRRLSAVMTACWAQVFHVSSCRQRSTQHCPLCPHQCPTVVLCLCFRRASRGHSHKGGRCRRTGSAVCLGERAAPVHLAAGAPFSGRLLGGLQWCASDTLCNCLFCYRWLLEVNVLRKSLYAGMVIMIEAR